MNGIVNKCLLAGDKFMLEMQKQPGFTYSACGSFTKNKERIQKFKEKGDTKYIYVNDLDKVCFQPYSGWAFSGLLTDGGDKKAPPSLKSVTHILQ